MPDFLFEIGVEELPASYLDQAIDQIAALATDELTKARLAHGEIRATGTPRRIVLHVAGLPAVQEGEAIEEWGPPESAAFKDGKPTKAAEGFAAKVKLPLEKIERKPKPGAKGNYLMAVRHVEGQVVTQLLGQTILPNIIKGISLPKSMTWVPGSKLRFARPIRSFIALLGGVVVDFEWNLVRAGKTTEGHRFLAPGPITLKDASWPGYVEALRERRVIVDREERRNRIRATVREQGSKVEPNEALVNTVANLVEWPEVMTGSFEPRFLEIPHCVIVSAIQTHLRGFPIFEAPGKVTHRFAFIANRPPDAVIREGNERVVRARLSDANFFYEEKDMKTPLKELAPRLKDVVFQDGLGSFWDKQERVARIATAIADHVGWAEEKAKIQRAASLMKADLLTEVVGEFPELQGEVGAVYAKKQGEPDDVAAAIREAYQPKGEADSLPETRTGICLSLAEKADNAACAFAVNMKPTGSKDPLGVRRQVIGALRTLRERGLALGVSRLFRLAVDELPAAAFEPKKKDDKKPKPNVDELRAKVHAELLDFARTRLEVLATPEDEKKKHKNLGELVQAVLASAVDEVPDFWARVEALKAIAPRPEFSRLVELVERTKNITKNEKDIPARIDASLLRESEEKSLAQALESVRAAVSDHLERRQYAEAGKRYMEALAEPVARFFEKVFVNDPDARLKANRMALLRDVHALLAERFADLAEVARKK